MTEYQLGALMAVAEQAASKMDIILKLSNDAKDALNAIDSWKSYIVRDRLMSNRMQLIQSMRSHLNFKKGYEDQKFAIQRGNQIADLRRRADLTQRELATKLNVSLSSVKSWESHKRNCPLSTLMLARVLIEA